MNQFAFLEPGTDLHGLSSNFPYDVGFEIVDGPRVSERDAGMGRLANC